MIGTPCYGSMLSTNYFNSAEETRQFFGQLNKKIEDPAKRYQLKFQLLGGESLISRGRNLIAQLAVDQGYDRLFFIDADCGWHPSAFYAVLEACSGLDNGYGIVGGSCPLKGYHPIGELTADGLQRTTMALNFDVFPEDERFLDEEHKTPEAQIRLYRHYRNTEKKLIPIPRIGTAFLCSDTKVFKVLKRKLPTYLYTSPVNGALMSIADYHPVGPIDGDFISEDYGFCMVARDNGINVWLQGAVCIDHKGSHLFRVDLEKAVRNVNREEGIADVCKP